VAGPGDDVSNAPAPKAQKDESIETLRGLALFLMVSGHVIGNVGDMGMRVPDDSGWRHFYYSLEFARMPLFTAISGFIYALRPLPRAAAAAAFIRGKARRLLLPMVFVGTLQYLALAAGAGSREPLPIDGIWRIYFYSFDHFWFLQAIFLIFLVTTALEAAGAMATFERWAIVFTLAALVNLWPPPVGFFSMLPAARLLPHFLLGIGIARFALLTKLGPYALPVLAGSVIYQQYTWFSPDVVLIKQSTFVAFLISTSALLVLFRYRRVIGPLATMGYYAYPVYLFHIFGTSPGRKVAQMLGFDSSFVVFGVSLVAGILVPVVIERLLSYSPVGSLLFLGLKMKPLRGDRA